MQFFLQVFLQTFPLHSPLAPFGDHHELVMLRIQGSPQRDDGIVVHLYVHFARDTEVNDLPGGITPAEFLRAEILHVLQNLILEFHRQEEPPWRASYACVNGRWGNSGGEWADVFKASHNATYP